MSSSIGKLVLPSFHDANLNGFAWSEDKVRIELSLQNKRTVVELTGVTRFLVNGLREGNIVREIVLFDTSNASDNPQEIREWVEFLVLGGKLVRENPAYEALDKSMRAVLTDIQAGRVSLFCVAQSYGCEMACLFKTLNVNSL